MASDRVREAFAGTSARLLALNRKYEPTNLSQLTANINPRA
jgi:hypothetical protein